LPTAQQQASELKPISTQPGVIEEQINETEVGMTYNNNVYVMSLICIQPE
jgi:hypothetical protein